MPNELHRHNIWRNVLTGVGVAVGVAVATYVVNRIVGSSTDSVISERSTSSNNSSEKTRKQDKKSNKNEKVKQAKLRKNIADQLIQGSISCPICLDEITNISKISSCKNCYQIYHISCLKDLISKSQGRTPTCPTCRCELPSNLVYTCFCGREVNPTPKKSGVTPHTCGFVCRRNERCLLLCHPGPCDT